MVSLKPTSVAASPIRSSRQQLLHRRFHVDQRLLHAAADVDRQHQIERHVVADQARDRLAHAVFEQLEILLFQPPHEDPAVGHDERHQDRRGANPFRVADVPGPEIVHQPPAVLQRGDDPDVMAAHDVAGFEGAGEGRPIERARDPAVDGEGHGANVRRVRRGIDRHVDAGVAAHEDVGRRSGDAKRRSLLREGGRRQERDRHDGANGGQCPDHRRRHL